MSENDIKANINILVQEIERIENILTDRDLYSVGLSPKPPRMRTGMGFRFDFYLKLINDIGENIYNIYYPRSTGSTAFKKLLETKIAMAIGIEEYNFYKDAIKEDEEAFIRGSRSQDGKLSYSDLIKLNAYIELFHSVAKRAKDLVKTMITDSVEEALDISMAVESLCIVGINPNLGEIVQLCMDARKLISESKCENFKDAFAILLDVNIDNLMEEKIQNSVVSPKDRILELEKNNSNLITGHSNTGKRALELNINRYLREGKFENLSEIYNICIDPIIDSRYKNNPFKEIFKRLDQGEKLMESDIERFKNNIKSSLRNFNANSIRGRILKKFSKPELINIFNELANDKFDNLGDFIVYEVNKNLEEVSERERKNIEIQQTINKSEVQRIKDRNLRIIKGQQAEVQAKCIQLLDTKIPQKNKNSQEVNINDFESMVCANSILPVPTIYQTCIAGAIMFFTPEDPLEKLFVEVDKIMSRSDNVNKKDKISNKMKELGNEINDFLEQIGEDDREKLKMYLSNPVLQRVFNEKTDNLYSKLILGQIITMMAGFEKNTRCCIY